MTLELGGANNKPIKLVGGGTNEKDTFLRSVNCFSLFQAMPQM